MRGRAVSACRPTRRWCSCYEAGRDGFWLHRYLVAQGITDYVVDSASIEVNRRARRTKTDTLDLIGLLHLLARYVGGDLRCWRVVRVPNLVDEDARHLHRTWEALQQDRTRVINRLKALLATLGVRLPIGPDSEARIEDARLWDGMPIPNGARRRLRMIRGTSGRSRRSFARYGRSDRVPG